MYDNYIVNRHQPRNSERIYGWTGTSDIAARPAEGRRPKAEAEFRAEGPADQVRSGVYPTPDSIGRFHNQLELTFLLVLGEGVTFLRRGETALGGDSELVEIGIF